MKTEINTNKTKTAERRDAPPVLLKLTPTDRQRAEEIAEKHHLPLTTWVYTAFKKAIEEEQ